jgi:hypothetical protein
MGGMVGGGMGGGPGMVGGMPSAMGPGMGMYSQGGMPAGAPPGGTSPSLGVCVCARARVAFQVLSADDGGRLAGAMNPMLATYRRGSAGAAPMRGQPVRGRAMPTSGGPMAQGQPGTCALFTFHLLLLLPLLLHLFIYFFINMCIFYKYGHIYTYIMFVCLFVCKCFIYLRLVALPTYVQRREELGLEWSLALVAAYHQRHLVSWRFSYRACFCLLASFVCFTTTHVLTGHGVRVWCEQWG